MKKTNKTQGINRRKFLQTSSTLAAAAMILPFGSTNVFAAFNSNSTLNQSQFATLNNGVKIPMLGFGTLDLRGEVGINCVAEAINLGYRLIDTARIYGNEAAVGKGIKKSGINREELFVTSKLWVDDFGYESTKKAFAETLDLMGLEYLDLFLIHRPRGDVKGSWQAMEELYAEGKIKAIGVSNFELHQLKELMSYAKITPAINQVETHVFFQQHEAQKYMKDFGIQMQAWSPFAQGRNGLFTNETLAEIGKKYNKTNAQVSLRWLFQRGIVSIPRTSKKAHMIENKDIFDFELSQSDMETIAKLDLNKTQFPEWG